MRIDHVAIIGAGFSGTLQAINLLRHKGPRATLIERAATLTSRGISPSGWRRAGWRMPPMPLPRG